MNKLTGTAQKRLFFVEFTSAGEFPDGRIKLDVRFTDSTGAHYVWTHDWEKGTRSFFLEAARVEKLNVPGGPEANRFAEVAATVVKEARPAPDDAGFKLWALDLSNAIRYAASENQIDRVAAAVFDFHRSEHKHPGITSGKWQKVFDWIVSLFEQPFSDGDRKSLLGQFVDNLTPADDAARGLLADRFKK